MPLTHRFYEQIEFQLMATKGAPYSDTFTIKDKTTGLPIDLTSANAYACWKKDISDSASLVTLAISWDRTAGKVTFTLTVAQTSSDALKNISSGLFDYWVCDSANKPIVRFKGTLTLDKALVALPG